MKAILVGWMSCALATVQILASNTDAVNEVLKLQKAGLSEEVIVAFIRGQSVNYALTADDMVFLKDLGLTSAELGAMLEVSNAANAAPATMPPAGPPPTADPGQPPAAMPTVMPEAAPQTVIASPAESPQSAYFYQELSPYGRWILGEDNEWYWQPNTVVGNVEWRPYWDNGRWIYTDAGWYWGSDYPWGWVAFHYGRWHLHPHHGWIWYPGREWGPAWVTWRSGGDYCGWAPLPPHAHFDGPSGRYFYRGHAVEVNFDFGLSFGHFNFCYTRQMGAYSRTRFHNEREVRNIYSHTTIINNYTVDRGGNREGRIVNRGIEPDRIVAHGGRPVERVEIHDRQSPSNGRSSESVDMRAKTLTVYRPKLAEERPGTRATITPGVARPATEGRRPAVSQSPANPGSPATPGVGRTGIPANERGASRPGDVSRPTSDHAVPTPASPTQSPARPAVRNPGQTAVPATPANPAANTPARAQERPSVTPRPAVPSQASPSVTAPARTQERPVVAPRPAAPAPANPGAAAPVRTQERPAVTPRPTTPSPASPAVSPARIQERPVAAPRQSITPPERAPSRSVPSTPRQIQTAPSTPSRSATQGDRGQAGADRRNR